eukprot:CAMPEP_0196772856 /NCGR_PEP_ID=MMETSP1104-20130614/2459_1 /TAXON_ID=33652 /ORGANISM="Cafeteria sp., Strain Caron Lab Isolate" /LENGTH=45 /DNA_ID= /DNA_START= /DNA_END= /DNA_ORIENTATION=
MPFGSAYAGFSRSFTLAHMGTQICAGGQLVAGKKCDSTAAAAAAA